MYTGYEEKGSWNYYTQCGYNSCFPFQSRNCWCLSKWCFDISAPCVVLRRRFLHRNVLSIHTIQSTCQTHRHIYTCNDHAEMDSRVGFHKAWNFLKCKALKWGSLKLRLFKIKLNHSICTNIQNVKIATGQSCLPAGYLYNMATDDRSGVVLRWSSYRSLPMLEEARA